MCTISDCESKSCCTEATTAAASLTFSVCFLHSCVLFLKVCLQVFEDLDFKVDGRRAVGQDAVVQRLHLRHKHLAGMHDHKET